MKNTAWRGYVKKIVAEYPSIYGADDDRARRKRAAVEAAIAKTNVRANAALRMKVIDTVFWKRSHTVGGAALLIPCHVNTARAWQNEFLEEVAKALDLP